MAKTLVLAEKPPVARELPGCWRKQSGRGVSEGRSTSSPGPWATWWSWRPPGDYDKA